LPDRQVPANRRIGCETAFGHQDHFIMRFYNAILLYPDGLAPGINLDNGFFSKAAKQILTYKKAAFRRKKNSYTGLTRILGIGKFGEFATLTLEEVTKPLMEELRRKKKELKPEDRCAEYAGSSFALILRIYAPTNPGNSY
jgi:hypothetical protein